ncbi:MAG: co-chaperone GroES [Bdellovibrio sp.]
MKGSIVAKKKASTKKAAVKKVVKKKSPSKVKASSRAVKKATGKKTSPKKVSTAKKSVKSPQKTAAVRTGASSPKKPVKATATATRKTTPTAPTKKAVTLSADLSHVVTPLDDRLVVRLSGVEKRTPGGLYIPDTVADVSGNLEGLVVAVGRGHLNKKGHTRPMDVQVGDRVVFSEYAGSKIKIQNEELIILREGDVMGVVAK